MDRTTMRALLLRANAEFEVIDIPIPDDPQRVLVRVVAAGVCGSDLGRAFEGGAYRYPLVMGHEISGVVERAPTMSAFAAGDRVAVYPLIPCRRCAACEVGAFQRCADYDYLGSRSDGAFAEFLPVPEANLFRVPDHLETVDAALTEPVAVALHAVSKLTIRPGADSAVYGGGPIGLLAAEWLRLRGCRRVFVVDIDPEKLELAATRGFTPVDSRVEDAVAFVRATAGGAGEGDRRGTGVEYVVEACGLPVTYRQAIASVADGGEVVLMGNLKGVLEFAPEEISSVLRREITIHGTWNSSIAPRGGDEWSASLEAMGRSFEIAPLISHRITLEEAPAFLGAMHRREVDHLRVVILPSAEYRA